MTLPGTGHIAYRDGRLQIEALHADDLAARFSTPLYVYSRASMRSALAPYQRALARRDHLICYAMKANSNLAVLQTFAEAGCGFDIVSGGELERVLAAGGDPAKVVFSGLGKTRDEMRRALEVGVHCFNVESEAELDALNDVAVSMGRRAPLSLRVNPDVDAKTHPYISTGLKGNKFGVAHERAVAVYRRAAALPGIDIVGIDCHIGSQITEAGPYLEALERMLDLVEQIEAEGLRLRHLDLGGGLGVQYTDETPPDADALIGALLERIDARGHGHRRLVFEPGRSLVAAAGLLITEVLYLKPGTPPSSDSTEPSKSFCVVDAAMNDLLRPAMYQATMAIVPCTLRDDTPMLCDVVGPVCESGDWLGRDRSLAVRQGDHLAVLTAGAYGMSMASNYNTRPRAAEVMVDGDSAVLIRERESTTELFRGEKLLPRS